MQCVNCKSEVTIITPHEQFLFGASGLCSACRVSVIEESYQVQDRLACCRNCLESDWVEEVIICGITKNPVSTVGICNRCMIP